MGAKETFGDRLKQLRGSMNQKELADALGVSRASIGYYENATRTPDIEILEKVSKHFGVSYDFLMGESEVKYRENADIAERTGLSENAIQKLVLIKSRGMEPMQDLINILIEQEVLPPNQHEREGNELEMHYQECKEKGYSRILSTICSYFRLQASPGSKVDIPGVYDSWSKGTDTFTVTCSDIRIMLDSGSLMEIEEQLKILRSRIGGLWGPRDVESMKEAVDDGNP